MKESPGYAGSKGARMTRILRLTLNGRARADAVPDNLLLLDYLRDQARLTSVKQGCDGGECGACMVLVDGAPRAACITLAATCDGATIETLEGLIGPGGALSPLQRAFHERLGAQCGFCTPGMVVGATALLRENPRPGEGEIRAALEGNLCRCTGYVKIIDAVQTAAAEMAGEAASEITEAAE
jgi:4-hydroxybenzoyl-CoA reductase subunit gamma